MRKLIQKRNSTKAKSRSRNKLLFKLLTYKQELLLVVMFFAAGILILLATIFVIVNGFNGR